MKGIVYSISSNNKLYIGSTIRTLKKRLQNHGCFDLYDMDEFNYTLKVLEEIEIDNKIQLRKREQYYIDNNNCVNKIRAFGGAYNSKEYYQINREKLLEKSKKQYWDNTERKKQYDKIYNEKNKVKKQKQWKQKYETQKEKINEKRKEVNDYKCSWGGDYRANNNLLQIDISLFH